MAMVDTDRITELAAVSSTGTVGDSYDNARAESIHALSKTEPIRARGLWRTVEFVKLATLFNRLSILNRSLVEPD